MFSTTVLTLAPSALSALSAIPGGGWIARSGHFPGCPGLAPVRTGPKLQSLVRQGSSPTVFGMLRVGLSGGIGSGKSTVARALARRGAVVIDADAIAREVVEPGQPGLAAVVSRFGPEVLDGGGRLDRPALAALVFDDAAARADLNAIVHPPLAAEP